MRNSKFGCLILTFVICATLGAAPVHAQPPGYGGTPLGRRAAPRDAFPVFNAPRMIPAGSARHIGDGDWVIGVYLNGKARAYPIAVMGIHELGNDTCGGVPIAVSW